MKRTIFFLIFLVFSAHGALGQENSGTINTGGANFLLIQPDARSAAMGGASVALTGYPNAIFHNGAALLDRSNGGIAYTYSPWLRDFESGYRYHSVGGYYKFNGRHAVLAGFRYYRYPEMGIYQLGEATAGSLKPKELAVDLGYTYRVARGLAVSATARYIHSDMGMSNSADAVAFDIGALYRRQIRSMSYGIWSLGARISNVGTRLNYDDVKQKLPAMASLGGSFECAFLRYNILRTTAQLGYRLMPSDVRALSVGAGAEIELACDLIVRGGYRYGDKNKGDYSYGLAGIAYDIFGIQPGFTWIFAEKDIPIRNSFLISLGIRF